MILVIAVMGLVWMGLRKRGTSSVFILAAVGLAAASLVTVGGSTHVVAEIPVDSEQALRVFGQAAFPFIIQQDRDYASRTCQYAIVLGYPDGIPLVESSEIDDHYIHATHYVFTAYLAALNLAAMGAALVAFAIVDRNISPGAMRPTRSLYLWSAAAVGAVLLAQVGFLALIQAPIHFITAIVVLVTAMLILTAGVNHDA